MSSTIVWVEATIDGSTPGCCAASPLIVGP
jgi:hypothetical protein